MYAVSRACGSGGESKTSDDDLRALIRYRTLCHQVTHVVHDSTFSRTLTDIERFTRKKMSNLSFIDVLSELSTTRMIRQHWESLRQAQGLFGVSLDGIPETKLNASCTAQPLCIDPRKRRATHYGA